MSGTGGGTARLPKKKIVMRKNFDDPQNAFFYCDERDTTPEEPTLITTYPRITSTADARWHTLGEVYTGIITGKIDGVDMAPLTAQIHSNTDPDVQNRRKQNLPSVCFNGKFGYRNEQGLQAYSGYVALDLDHLTDVDATFDTLRANPDILLMYRTPRAHGLKIVLRHTNAEPIFHKDLFNQVCDRVNLPGLDRSVGDIARVHFLCHDPHAYYNPDARTFLFVQNFASLAPLFAPSAPSSPSAPASPSMRTGESMSLNRLRGELSMIDLPACALSVDSLLACIDAAFDRKHPQRFHEGHRACAVFAEACQLCRNGVNIDVAIGFLDERYGETGAGLPYWEVEKAVEDAYRANLDMYGSCRGTWKKL